MRLSIKNHVQEIMDGAIIYIKILSSVKKDLITNLLLNVLFFFFNSGILFLWDNTIDFKFGWRHSFLGDNNTISAYLFPVFPNIIQCFPPLCNWYIYIYGYLLILFVLMSLFYIYFTGCSGDWFSFYCLHGSNDTFPCISLLVSDVLPHARQSRAWQHVWNHWRDHHTCCGHFQSEERNSYWWVLMHLTFHWTDTGHFRKVFYSFLSINMYIIICYLCIYILCKL